MSETEIKIGDKPLNDEETFIFKTQSGYQTEATSRENVYRIEDHKNFKSPKTSTPPLPKGRILNKRTLVKGVDKSMSEKFDEKYAELKEDLRESERRVSHDLKEREQRLEKEIIRREERFEKSLEKFATDAKEREERYINNIEEIKQIVKDGEANRRSTTIAIWTLAITTILSIAAMVITVAVS